MYANLAGIPLPALGLLSYISLLILLIVQGGAVISARGWSPFVALAIFGISMAGVLYSAYLRGVVCHLRHLPLVYHLGNYNGCHIRFIYVQLTKKSILL